MRQVFNLFIYSGIITLFFAFLYFLWEIWDLNYKNKTGGQRKYWTNQTMINYNDQPAFPPSVAQDNLGRIIAPIPGMSKLEFAAIILLPTYIQLREKKDGLTINGQIVTPYQAAIYAAKRIIDELNAKENETADLYVAE